MSQATQSGADTGAVEQATQVILQNVHAPAFFQKLAGHGIVPQTEDEATTLLELGFKLAAVSAEVDPQPAPVVNSFAKAASDLDLLLGGAAGQEAGLQAAAQELLAYPEIAKAAEAILAAQAG